MISRFSRFFHCCLLLFGVFFSPHSAGMGSLFSFIFCKVFFTFFFNFFIFFHFFLFSSFVVVFRMGLVFISQTQSTTSRAWNICEAVEIECSTKFLPSRCFPPTTKNGRRFTNPTQSGSFPSRRNFASVLNLDKQCFLRGVSVGLLCKPLDNSGMLFVFLNSSK